MDRVYYCRQEESADLLEWYLSQLPRPTAGLIFNRAVVDTFLPQLHRRGIRYPQDILLVCKTCEGEPVKVASVCTDAFGLGRFAAEMLIGRASGKYRAGMRVSFASRLENGSVA